MLQSKLCFHADLIYHLLAHMNLQNNASNLFCSNYIKNITTNKSNLDVDLSLSQELEQLINIYLNDFQKLCLINFFPFYATDLNQTRAILLDQPFYTNENKESFLIPFLNIAQKEADIFYSHFWSMEIEKYSELINEFNVYFDENLLKFTNIFKFFKVSPSIYLSLSLTQNGRGFSMKDYFTAIVPLPKSTDEFNKLFIQAFHEMTHQFTDNLIDSKISMEDGTHKLSEHLAILTDFYLFKKYLPSMLTDYCTMFGIKECSEDSAKEQFPILPELHKKMLSLLMQF